MADQTVVVRTFLPNWLHALGRLFTRFIEGTGHYVEGYAQVGGIVEDTATNGRALLNEYAKIPAARLTQQIAELQNS